jgi:hypothetical protein
MDCHTAPAPGDHRRAQIFGFVLGTCHADEQLDGACAPYPEEISLELLARIAWRRHAALHIGDPGGRDTFVEAYIVAYRSAAERG